MFQNVKGKVHKRLDEIKERRKQEHNNPEIQQRQRNSKPYDQQQEEEEQLKYWRECQPNEWRQYTKTQYGHDVDSYKPNQPSRNEHPNAPQRYNDIDEEIRDVQLNFEQHQQQGLCNDIPNHMTHIPAEMRKVIDFEQPFVCVPQNSQDGDSDYDKDTLNDGIELIRLLGQALRKELGENCPQCGRSPSMNKKCSDACYKSDENEHETKPKIKCCCCCKHRKRRKQKKGCSSNSSSVLQKDKEKKKEKKSTIIAQKEQETGLPQFPLSQGTNPQFDHLTNSVIQCTNPQLGHLTGNSVGQVTTPQFEQTNNMLGQVTAPQFDQTNNMLGQVTAPQFPQANNILGQVATPQYQQMPDQAYVPSAQPAIQQYIPPAEMPNKQMYQQYPYNQYGQYQQYPQINQRYRPNVQPYRPNFVNPYQRYYANPYQQLLGGYNYY